MIPRETARQFVSRDGRPFMAFTFFSRPTGRLFRFAVEWTADESNGTAVCQALDIFLARGKK